MQFEKCQFDFTLLKTAISVKKCNTSNCMQINCKFYSLVNVQDSNFRISTLFHYIIGPEKKLVVQKIVLNCFLTAVITNSLTDQNEIFNHFLFKKIVKKFDKTPIILLNTIIMVKNVGLKCKFKNLQLSYTTLHNKECRKANLSNFSLKFAEINSLNRRKILRLKNFEFQKSESVQLMWKYKINCNYLFLKFQTFDIEYLKKGRNSFISNIKHFLTFDNVSSRKYYDFKLHFKRSRIRVDKNILLINSHISANHIVSNTFFLRFKMKKMEDFNNINNIKINIKNLHLNFRPLLFKHLIENYFNHIINQTDKFESIQKTEISLKKCTLTMMLGNKIITKLNILNIFKLEYIPNNNIFVKGHLRNYELIDFTAVGNNSSFVLSKSFENLVFSAIKTQPGKTFLNLNLQNMTLYFLLSPFDIMIDYFKSIVIELFGMVFF